MKKPKTYNLAKAAGVLIVVILAVLVVMQRPSVKIRKALAAYSKDASYGHLKIDYPLDETLFPAGDRSSGIPLERR